MIPVSQSAQEVCQWLQCRSAQSQSLPIIQLSDIPCEYRLSIFGLLHGHKVVTLLQGEEKMRFAALFSFCAKALPEIVKNHFPSLLTGQPIKLPDVSVFKGRSFVETPLAEHIVEQFRKIVVFAPNPVPYCLTFNATLLLPDARLDPPAMGDFLMRIMTKQNWAIQQIFSWFGTAVPTEQKRTLTQQEAVDLQMTLLRYEVWPQMSYADCIKEWLQSHIRRNGPGCVHAALAARWQEFSPFCGLLEPSAQVSTASWQKTHVCFGREAGHVLAENETLRVYISSTRCQLFLRSLRAILPITVVDDEFTSFSALIYKTFEPEFADAIRGSHRLFFIDLLSRSYRPLHGKPRDELLHSAKECFKSHLDLLEKLFFYADSNLREHYHTSFSLASSILAYVHTLTVVPTEYRAHLPISSFRGLLEYTYSVPGWILRAVDGDPCAGLNQCLSRIQQSHLPVMLVRFVLEASGLSSREPDIKSLSDHLFFVELVERISGLTMNPDRVNEFLFAQFLTDEQVAWVTQVLRFVEILQPYAFHNVSDLPSNIYPAIGEWIAQNTLFNTFTEAGMRFFAELLQLLYCAFFIPGLGGSFFRMLHLCYPSGTKMDRARHWADVHNGALRELAPNIRSLRIELIPQISGSGHKLTVFWLRSCHHPDTRYFEMELPDLRGYNSQELIQMMERNCQDATPVDERQGDDTVRALSTKLRCGIRRLVVGVDEPVVRYDAEQSRFLVQTPQAHFELSFVQYSTVLQALSLQIQQKQAIQCPQLCLLRLQSDVAIDCVSSYQLQTCMGEDDDELKDIPKECYRVEFRLSQAPHTSFFVIYDTAPTPLLLAWQLAVLKWRCLNQRPLA